jgi:short-subunit dehydrogenase
MLKQGDTVLITGASSGLGRGIALALASRGCNLILTARRRALLEEVAQQATQLGASCLVVPADATLPAESLAVVHAGVERFGRIDAAVLNAGGGNAMTMGQATTEEVLWMMRTNFDTLVTFLCPLIEHMRGHKGLIAYTGSPAGFFGLPKSGPYSAAKAAGRLLLDTCRVELAGAVDFVALYPGFTATPGLDPDDVPSPWLIMKPERAVREMLWAIDRRRSHHLFPLSIRFLISLGRFLPEPLRRVVLQRFA